MRHLFIINPVAFRVKGRAGDLAAEVELFFNSMKMFNYDIHVTRWARDGMGFVNRYVRSAREPVRVHAMGGAGTLYEAVNGVIGLPNAEVAAYPLGGGNFCVRYFGADREYMFRSLRNQVFSSAIPLDAIRGDNVYGIGFALMGLEAEANRRGAEMLERISLPPGLCYFLSAAEAAMRGAAFSRNYKVEVDGADRSGEYASILISGYGGAAPGASQNEGNLDVYMMRSVSPVKYLSVIDAYVHGKLDGLRGLVMHVRGQRVSVSSDRDMTVSVDGETFTERVIRYESAPAAINFVCPDGINANRLAGIEKLKTDEGGRGERR